MRRFLVLSFALILAGGLSACDSFVQEVNEPRDSAPVENFNTPEDIRFLVTGVRASFAEATGETVPVADLISDQFRFGRNSTDATFPTFINLDAGVPQVQNNSVDAAYNDVGEYRRLADDLLTAIREVDEFGEGAPVGRDSARYVANLHGGIARYYYATYFGLNPREGGGVIDESSFIPSPAMYDSARVKFERARDVSPPASDTFRTRVLNSVEARSALYAGTQFGPNTGGYSNALERAATLAEQGLRQGESLVIPYAQQDPNGWYFVSGVGRIQVSAQDGDVAPEVQTGDGAYENPGNVRSFRDILSSNSAEEARVPLRGVDDDANIPLPFDDPNAVDVAQGKYVGRSAGQEFITWQENFLMRAELEVRGFDAGSESPLQLVNTVRSSYGLSTLSSLGSNQTERLSAIAQERDRTMFANGQRLPDQRRFDDSIVDWHLVEQFEGTTTWQYLPITLQERDNNPNL